MLRGMKTGEERPAPNSSVESVWFLYILQCRDGSFYTGVTNDIDRRIKAHQEGTASRYTRIRRPVVLVYREKCGSRSASLARECAVRNWVTDILFPEFVPRRIRGIEMSVTDLLW